MIQNIPSRSTILNLHQNLETSYQQFLESYQDTLEKVLNNCDDITKSRIIQNALGKLLLIIHYYYYF